MMRDESTEYRVRDVCHRLNFQMTHDTSAQLQSTQDALCVVMHYGMSYL